MATCCGGGKGDGESGVLLSHSTGNQNVRNALRSLVEHEMLAQFWTSIAWNSESRWNRLLPEKLREQFARRAFADVPMERIHCVPSREVVRLGSRFLGVESLLGSAQGPFSVIGMNRHFDRRVALSLPETGLHAVYAYEGGALETLCAAKRRGAVAICEMQSSHWRWWHSLLRVEAENNPRFGGLLPQLNNSQQHVEQKDEELAVADLVFVPSQHVKRTLSGVVADEKIRVVSYGAPPVCHKREVARNAAQPLRVLFVGALAQHKGIGYLLDAVDLLGRQVELTLVGRRARTNQYLDAACNRFRWFENLLHHQVLEVMAQSDVLVLPSFGEGFGLVVTEALACGLPVIVTPNVGASDIVREGREGFVVPVGSAEAIAQRLDALNRDRELLAEMSANAQTTAAMQSWEGYRRAWAETVRAAAWH